MSSPKLHWTSAIAPEPSLMVVMVVFLGGLVLMGFIR
jgi:hypothetical protein